MTVNRTEERLELTAVDRGAAAVVDRVRGSVANLRTGLDTVQAALAAVGVTIGAGAMLALYSQVVKTTAALDDMAEQTGASVENLSKLQTVAKIGGKDFDGLGEAMGKMIKGLKGANEEGQAAGKALDFLGIKAKDSNGRFRDSAEILTDIAKKLATYEDGGNKVALVQDLLGKSGARYLSFLKDLAEEGNLAARVTTQQAAEAEKLEKNINRLKLGFEDARRELTLQFTPALVDFTQKLLAAQKASGGFIAGLATMATAHSADPGARIREIDAKIAAHEKAISGAESSRWMAPSWAGGGQIGFQMSGVGQAMSGMSISRLMAEREYLRSVERQQALAATGAGDYDARDIRLRTPQALYYESPAKEGAAGRVPVETDEYGRRIAALSAKSDAEYLIAQERLMQERDDMVRDSILREKKERERANEEMVRSRERAVKALDELNQREWEKRTREFERMRDSLENAMTQGAVDGLMRGFEKGESVAANFLRTLKNLFATTVLTAMVRPIMQPIANLATGAFQGLGGSVFGGGGIGSMLSGASSLGSMGGVFGSGSTMMGVSELAAGGAMDMGIGGIGAAMGVGGGGMSAALAAVPGWGWAALGATALMTDGFGLFGGGGGPKDPTVMLQRDPVSGKFWNVSENMPGAEGQLASALPWGTLNDPKQYDPNVLGGLVGRQVGSVQDLMAMLEPARQAAQGKVQSDQALIASERQLIAALNNVATTLEDKLGINSLMAAQNDLAISDYQTPLDRFAAAREQLDSTYSRAMGGDLSAVSAFPDVLQSALGVGRDVYASGPQFAELFTSGNRMLQDLLQNQRGLQDELTRSVPFAIHQASNDQVAELRRGFNQLSQDLQNVQTELRRIQTA